MAHVGTSRPLIDGRERVLGATRFGTDQSCPGMLHGRLVTSPYAHATFSTLQTEEARATEGVTAVITADDLPSLVPATRGRLLLARHRVIFVGQPVALVLAETEAAAEDGAEKVVVDCPTHLESWPDSIFLSDSNMLAV